MTFSEDFRRNGTAGKADNALTPCTFHALPELQGHFSLFLLTDEMGQESFDDLLGLNAAGLKTVHGTLSSRIGLFLDNISTVVGEKPFESIDRSRIGHANRKVKFVSGRNLSVAEVAVGFTSNNADATFSVKKSSQIVNTDTVIHTAQSTLDHLIKQANSVDLPTAKASGQYRAKQGVNRLLGVCREHRLAPKGMMCSELHGNVESTAEMPVPASV